MDIYSTKAFRKIYESYNGSIPKDEYGRTYEIHHIDGNHSNCDPRNLIAVTIKEHYDIHFAQHDWAACLLMSGRMKISPNEKSRLASLAARRLVKEGKHHFLNKKKAQERAMRQVENGTHNFLGDGELQRKNNLKRVENGTHNLVGGEITRKQLTEGKHSSQKKWVCEICGKNGSGSGNYAKWHGKECGKIKINSPEANEKNRQTYKEKYANGYINNRSKTWNIINMITGEESRIVGLKTWSDQNGYNSSTVDWAVRKYKKYEHYLFATS